MTHTRARTSPPYIYVIALGSNRARSAQLTPDAMVAMTMRQLNTGPCRLISASATLHSAPIGPSLRTYSNAAAMIECALPPHALLAHLKALEQQAGRQRGQRWGARPLDLDIILWSGGRFAHRTLRIPHSAYRERSFVLAPLAQIVPKWRDPITGTTISQLYARYKRSKPVDLWRAAL